MAQLIEVYLQPSKFDQSKKDEKGNYRLIISVGEQEDQFGNNVKAWHKCEKEEEKKYVANGKTFWANKGEHIPARERRNDTQTPPNLQGSNKEESLPF